MGIFTILSPKAHDEERRARQYRQLISKEAKMGGLLFGPVPEGARREFFCLDARTWIWHEEWTTADGQLRIITTRYDVRPNGVLKAQDGQPYRFIDAQEAKHLYKAMRMYVYKARTELYSHVK